MVFEKKKKKGISKNDDNREAAKTSKKCKNSENPWTSRHSKKMSKILETFRKNDQNVPNPRDIPKKITKTSKFLDTFQKNDQNVQIP